MNALAKVAWNFFSVMATAFMVTQFWQQPPPPTPYERPAEPGAEWRRPAAIPETAAPPFPREDAPKPYARRPVDPVCTPDRYAVLCYFRLEVSDCRGGIGAVHPDHLKNRYGDRFPIVYEAALSNVNPAFLPEPPEAYAASIRKEYRATRERGCGDGFCPAPARP